MGWLYPTTTDPPLDEPHPPSDATVSSQQPGLDRRTLQQARRKEAKKRRRKWPKRLLIAAVVIVALLVAVGASGFVYANYRFNEIKKIHARHLVAQAPPGQPFNILIVGSDSRSFVKTAKEAQEFGTPTAQGGQRSDVDIIARFIPATKQVWLLSIPRDLWVDIPGDGPDAGTNRINAAFNTGPDLLIQTIEHDLKIPINHYVSVNFTGFQAMVNALGGVTMNFPDPVRDPYSGLDVTQTGCQTVDGATALELTRARHLSYETTGEWQYDGLSDFSRIQRQDAFFRAVLTKLGREKLNPFTINSFIGAAVKDLTIDTTLTEGDLLSIAEGFHGLTQADLHTETLPTFGFTTTAGADVLGEAVPEAAQMVTAFNAEGATSAASTTTSKGSGSTSTTTTTDPPSDVEVEVLNGVDFTKPIASDTGADLKKAGFVVTSTANADAQVATTEIQYATGHEAAAQTVADHLSGNTQLTVDPSLSGDRVILTVGTSFTGVTTSSTSTGTSTSSGTTSSGTTSSGTTSSGTGSSGTTSTGGTATGSTTTTTPPGEIYTNTQPESWNPVPCVQ